MMQGIDPNYSLESEVADEIQGNIAKQNMDEINASIAQQRAAGFRSSMQVASQFDPAKFATAKQVERESGIPARIAYENSDQIEQSRRKNHLDGIFTNYQKTAKALSDPNVAILAKNDEESLTGLERAMLEDTFYKQGFFERQAINPAKQWWHRDTLSDVPDRIRELDQIEAEQRRVDAGEVVNSAWGREYQAADAAGKQAMREGLALQRNESIDRKQRATQALSEIPVDPTDIDMAAAEGVGGVLDVVMDDPMYLGRLFGQSSGDMVQGLGLNMVPGVGPLLAGTHEGSAGADHKVLELLQKEGVNTDDTIDLMRALRNDDLMENVNTQAKNYGLALGTFSVASNALLKNILAPTSINGKLLTKTAREQINLGVQMPAQALAEAGGEVAGMYAQRGEVSDISAKDAALEGLVGFATAPVEVGVFAGKRYYNGMIQARRAEQADKSQAKYAQHAAASEMRKLDPQSYKQVLDGYFAGTPGEFIEIPAAKLQELGQSANVDIPALLESVGIDQKHYDAQVNLGGSVRMENSAYLSYLVDHDEFLRSSIRMSQNDMSLDDVKVWEKEEVARLGKLAENFGKTEPVVEAYSDILGQLLSNGIERSTAEQYAKTFSVAAARVAEQSGQTVQEFLAANPLTIRDKAPKQLQRVKVEELDLMINRLREGDVPKPADMFGKSLLEQLTADGGVQDMGGELAALDADVGKVGRNRLTRPEGKTPDDAAMWAWERGYFPGVSREEVTPDLLVNAIRDELSGKPRYSVSNENQTLRDQADGLNALQEYLDRSGLDLSQMDNAQIIEALSKPQGEQSYNQDSYDPETLKWLRENGLINDDESAKLNEQQRGGENGRTGRDNGQGTKLAKTASGREVDPEWRAHTKVARSARAGGDAVRVYRGSRTGTVTSADFEQLGAATGYAPSGLGVWFSASEDVAQGYADATDGKVGEFYLDIRRPKKYDAVTLPTFDTIEDAKRHAAELRAQGFDGVVIDYRSEGGSIDFVAFNPEQVIVENGKTTLYQFAGQNARTANTDGMREAESLLKSGKSSEFVRQKTGWHVGADGMWRFEIADNDAKLTIDKLSDWKKKELKAGYLVSARLDLLLDHPRLYEAYPDLADMTVTFTKDNGDYHGVYYSRWNSIEIANSGDHEQMLSTLLHEVQHAIQFREKFANGGNTDREFTDSVRSALLTKRNQSKGDIEYWNHLNKWKVDNAQQASEVASYGLMYESAQRLIDYSRRDSPSGVFRLIRNEMQWLYHEKFYGNREANDIQRLFYDMPKRHNAQKRNAYIRNMAFDAGRFILDQIPADLKEQFKNDPRTMKGMLKALARESEKARQQLEPLRKLQDESRALGEVQDAHQYSSPYQVYRALAGEVEARNTQKRQSMDDAQRRETSPRQTQDVDPKHVIVMFGGMDVQAPVAMSSKTSTMNQPDGGEGSPDDNRGSITFGGRKDGVREFTINLGQKSDLSTVLHEFGHYYLEVIGDLVGDGKANAELTADYAEIRKWLGAEDGAKLTVDQHEQFARGFEKYLAEGKAPSLELQGAFARFKRWMIEIYKDLSRLNVELTPEIRGVFDRLLASEEAIAEAEQHESAVQKYESQILALMTDDEQERYRAAVAAAHDEAVTEIEQEILRAEKRKEQAWYREERAKVEAEVRDDLEKQPAYQARKYLFGKTPHPKTGTVIKLDSGATNELFGTRNKDARFLSAAKRTTGGMHPEAAATLLGFDSATQMLTEMRSVPNLGDAVKAETERQMAERYPNPMIDGTLSDKAAHAVGEKQAEVHAIQFRALAKQAGRKASPQKAIREAARRHIARLKLRDVVPSTFQRAVNKASREVEEALLAGDTIAAYEAKERQLMNMALLREAQTANELADQKRDQAKAYTKKGAKRDRLQKASVENYEVTYPDGRVEYTATKAAADRAEKEGATVVPLFNFLEQVDGLLHKYEFSNPRGIIRKQRQSLVAFLQEMAAENIVVNPAEWILLDRAERTNWKDLTIEQLVDAVDMIRQIDQMAKNKLDVLRGDKWMEFEPLRDAVVESVIANGSKAAMLPFTRTYGEQLRKWGRQWLGMLPADQIARELDGQDDLGAVQQNITTPLQVAARQVVIREKLEHQGLADLFHQFYSPAELKGLSEKREAVPEIGDSMTRMEMIMLLANLGNDGNREALLSEERGLWTAQTIQAVVSRLDQRDADFVEGLWAWIDKFFPEVAELEAKRTGVAPPKVQASQYPVKLADGKVRVMKGGYFPLKYDSSVSIEAGRDEASNAFQNMTAGRTAKAYTPEGHKMERVGSGGRPVKLDFSVVITHVNDVVRDIVLTDPVNQSWRFLHDKEVRAAFEKANVKELWTALEIWIQDVAEGEQVSQQLMSGAARWLRTGFTANVMLFNIANSAMNLLGTHPAVVLGAKYAAIGYKSILSKSNWAQMYELSSYMREARMDSYNKDLSLVREQMEGGATWRRVMTQAGFYVHNQTQMLMDAVAWMGAYQKAQSLDLMGDEAVTYADQRVVEISGSGVFADRSALERGTFDAKTRQNEAVRGLTMLSGYLIRKMAIARRRTGETDFKQFDQAVWWAVDMSLLITWEAMAYALVKGNLPDDEDEDELAAAYLRTAGWETFNTVMGGLPPVGRPLAGAISGFGSGSSSYDVFGDQLGQMLAQAKQGEVDKAALRASVMMVGTATKTPGAATSKVIDWIDRQQSGEEPPWWEVFTGNRNK